MTQTTWRREKKETKSRNREGIKVEEEKKERDFNVNVSNVSVKVRVISFNERYQLSKFYWWSIKWSTIDEIEDLDSSLMAH